MREGLKKKYTVSRFNDTDINSVCTGLWKIQGRRKCVEEEGGKRNTV